MEKLTKYKKKNGIFKNFPNDPKAKSFINFKRSLLIHIFYLVSHKNLFKIAKKEKNIKIIEI
jgi:hypothetical protein